MKHGSFIALEGGEGAGKSTQTQLLAQALRDRGLEVVTTREPGGTDGAEAIRSLLLAPPDGGWGVRAEALLFAAARADHVEKCIRPALSRGAWVLCDRFVDSSRAYQGFAGGLGDDAIQQLHLIGSLALRPDLTILIEVEPQHMMSRLARRDGSESDAIGGRSAAYHARVASAFREIASGDENGESAFAIIDGNRSTEEVHNAILEKLAPVLNKFGA